MIRLPGRVSTETQDWNYNFVRIKPTDGVNDAAIKRPETRSQEQLVNIRLRA